MPYTMAEIEARAGVTSRTIREYIRLGLVRPPQAKGLGATYDEEQMLRAVTIARMRAAGETWETVGDRLGSSLASLRAYVRKTDPRPPDPPSPPRPAPAAQAEAPALEGQPVPPGLPPPGDGAPATSQGAIEGGGIGRETDLPGTHLVLAPLLPGLALLVERDAGPLVRRIAAEILQKYGVRR